MINENSEYRLQWDLLAAISSGCQSEAQEYWNQLRCAFPRIYGENLGTLQPSDQRSWFGRALAASLQPQKLKRDKTDEGQLDLIQKLLEALEESSVPLRKEELIEKIWSVPYDPHYDARFSKLMQRLKRQHGVKVVNAKRAYRLA